MYKLIARLLCKSNCKNSGIKILRIAVGLSIIVFLIISCKIGIWLYENPRVTDPNYDRRIYSIVLYNTTDVAVDDLEICVGDNRLLVQAVGNIRPKEYRKINISTHESDFIDLIHPPYNVYIRKSESANMEFCTGYFGIGTGGVELVNIVQNNKSNIILEQENHSSKEYIKVLKLHRTKQSLLNWYN